jgi:hypothetical protein
MLHTWLSQQDGVVLGAPAEDLDDTSHLTLTANDLQVVSKQTMQLHTQLALAHAGTHAKQCSCTMAALA